MSKRRLT